MICKAVFFNFILLPLILGEELSFRFADNSLIPRNYAALMDNSSDTCTIFQKMYDTLNQRYIHFRITPFPADTSNINVTITGKRFGCGDNLYVSPLSADESESWIGRWKRCMLVNTTKSDSKEECSYWCKSDGCTKEIQVIKIPDSADELDLEVCHISLKGNSSSYIGCSNRKSTKHGVNQVKLPNTNNYTDVYCDQTTNGGGWTILLRRLDGSENFVREWDDYKHGFGSLTGEFWAGNEMMHKITTDGQRYLLRVELMSYEEEFIYAEYSNFWIGPECDNYRLHITGYLPNSTAGDSLTRHNNMMFSTQSRDNDILGGSCCIYYGSPWWYKRCHTSLLTGLYGTVVKYKAGIIWYYDWGFFKFAKYVRMMIRPTT